MKRRTVGIISIMIGTLLIISLAFGKGNVHWGYSGHEGPEHWGELDRQYATCSGGKNQSPIDLTGFVNAELSPIEFNYTTHATEILNNGHSVQANYLGGSTISLDGHEFELQQFHFHAPSENHINGKSFPMEAHLVHANRNGDLAVVAVMFEEGKANGTMETLWSQIPKKKGDKYTLSSKVSASDLLPKSGAYYRFNGSLTTPPCSEGVWWLVMKESVSVSKEQVEAFSHVMQHPNNRPVQALNARPVLQ